MARSLIPVPVLLVLVGLAVPLDVEAEEVGFGEGVDVLLLDPPTAAGEGFALKDSGNTFILLEDCDDLQKKTHEEEEDKELDPEEEEELEPEVELLDPEVELLEEEGEAPPATEAPEEVEPEPERGPPDVAELPEFLPMQEVLHTEKIRVKRKREGKSSVTADDRVSIEHGELQVQ